MGNAGDYLQILREKQADLQQRILTARADLTVETGGDHLDVMNGVQRRDQAAKDISRLSQELLRVRRALLKIEGEGDVLSGDLTSFGECEICEGPISEARLKVQPEAPWCIKCAEENEK